MTVVQWRNLKKKDFFSKNDAFLEIDHDDHDERLFFVS